MSHVNQVNSDYVGCPAFVRLARIALVAFTLGLVAACSMSNDLGTTLAVPADFPRIRDVPTPSANALSPAEVTALRLELENLAVTHEQDREEQIK